MPQTDAYLDAASTLHGAITEAYAGVDIVAEDTAVPVVNRVKELIFDPSERDPVLWGMWFEDSGLDIEDADLSVQELLTIEIDERDSVWTMTMGAILATAEEQARAEMVLLNLWQEDQDGAEDILRASNKMSTGEIKSAARGPGKKAFDDAKSARRNNPK